MLFVSDIYISGIKYELPLYIGSLTMVWSYDA